MLKSLCRPLVLLAAVVQSKNQSPAGQDEYFVYVNSSFSVGQVVLYVFSVVLSGSFIPFCMSIRFLFIVRASSIRVMGLIVRVSARSSIAVAKEAS